MGEGLGLVLIAGPCVIEDESTTVAIARFLKDMAARLDTPLIFKASYDKANRTSIDSFRGPGLEKGLGILARVKEQTGVAVVSDVHRISELPLASAVLDVIQIPAFLCRQTDLIQAAAATGKPLNLKKGQFMAPWDMAHVVAKARAAGATAVTITERGASFGYNNLVVDMRGIAIMQAMGCPVIFDATHSVQLPGGQGVASGGQREYAPVLARAAVAAGADAVFMEVHPDPDRALCDGPNSLRLDAQLEGLILQLKAIYQLVQPSWSKGIER